MLSKKAIKEFQEIYDAQYGIKLSNEQAAECATRLLRLCKVVLKSDGKE